MKNRVKKLLAAAAAALLLCLMAAGALAASYGYAVIDGKTATKVHLREEASSKADSLGLFFTGTEVEMRSDPYAEWIKVRIEGASGYIHSAYLSQGSAREDVPEVYWRGVITAKIYTNFRRGPSTEYNLVGTIDAGESVKIMGQTSEGWYYVQYKGDWGYVAENLLRVSDRSVERDYEYDGSRDNDRYGVWEDWDDGWTDGWEDEWEDDWEDDWYDDGWEYGDDRDAIDDLIIVKPTATPKPTYRPRPTATPKPVYRPTAEPTAKPGQSAFPHGMPEEWIHLSGAGAWSTEMQLARDGRFTGYYHDSDADVVYESTFSGRFTSVRKRDAYSYTMTLSTLDIDGTVNVAYAKDGALYITQAPAGLKEGDEFVLYLPNTPKERLTEEELYWLHDDGGSTLDTYFLCNQNTGRGFMPESAIEDNG